MGIGYNPKIVTDGLVLCLDAANKKSYPGSGTTWFDLSSKKKVATLGATTSHSSNYMTFGGTGTNCEVILTTSDLNRNAGQGNTIEQWIYSSGRQSSGNMPFTFYSLDFDIWYSNVGNFGINNGSSLVYGISNADNILSNKWVHSVFYIPFSWSSDYLNTKMWINGVQQSMSVVQGSLVPKVISASQSIGIGGGFTNGDDTYNWNGRIAITNIYARELTTAEVQQNFNAMRGRFGV